MTSRKDHLDRVLRRLPDFNAFRRQSEAGLHTQRDVKRASVQQQVLCRYVIEADYQFNISRAKRSVGDAGRLNIPVVGWIEMKRAVLKSGCECWKVRTDPGRVP